VQSVFPGVVSHDFREKENQFNIYQQQRLSQEKLGWVVQIGWKNDALVNIQNTFKLKVSQKNGMPLKNARVTTRFIYPANLKYDQQHLLSESENGLYSTNIHLNQPGNWDVIVDIQHIDGNYELRSKTTLKLK